MVAPVKNNIESPIASMRKKHTFDRVLSSKEMELNFVYVRDFGNKVVYSG